MIGHAFVTYFAMNLNPVVPMNIPRGDGIDCCIRDGVVLVMEGNLEGARQITYLVCLSGGSVISYSYY